MLPCKFASKIERNEKFIITFCVLIAACAIPCQVNASDAKKHTTIQKIKTPNGRPSAPSNEVINLYIDGDTLIFDLPENVEYMTVELKQGDAVVLTGMVDHEDASLDVAGLHGEYEILCRTDGNQLFAGNIEL